MSVTPATFKTRFPEFVSEDDARVQLFLDDSELILNSAYWSDKLDLGTNYLTAHYLALANKTAGGTASVGISGPIAARAVDGASVTYAAGAAPKDQSDAYYLQTTYGQRYLALRKTLGVPAFVV